jgi:hypothetical protein
MQLYSSLKVGQSRFLCISAQISGRRHFGRPDCGPDFDDSDALFARMTKGLLSATTGLRDDPNQIQVSAEIQPGNSGGPLLDHDGHILGGVPGRRANGMELPIKEQPNRSPGSPSCPSAQQI